MSPIGIHEIEYHLELWLHIDSEICMYASASAPVRNDYTYSEICTVTIWAVVLVYRWSFYGGES